MIKIIIIIIVGFENIPIETQTSLMIFTFKLKNSIGIVVENKGKILNWIKMLNSI